MVNVQLSPGDPLFWLHHTWLDSLWWKWQSKNLPARLTEMSGPNIPPQFNFTFNGTFSPPAGFGPPLPCLVELLGNGTFPPFPFGNGSNPFNGTFPPANVSNPFLGTSPGNGSFIPPFPTAFKENKALTGYFNDDGGRFTTMNHTLWSAGIFPNATIAEVMDIRQSNVCAEYI